MFSLFSRERITRRLTRIIDLLSILRIICTKTGSQAPSFDNKHKFLNLNIHLEFSPQIHRLPIPPKFFSLILSTPHQPLYICFHEPHAVRSNVLAFNIAINIYRYGSLGEAGSVPADGRHVLRVGPLHIPAHEELVHESWCQVWRLKKTNKRQFATLPSVMNANLGNWPNCFGFWNAESIRQIAALQSQRRPKKGTSTASTASASSSASSVLRSCLHSTDSSQTPTEIE